MPEPPLDRLERRPPGQRLTKKWPVLHEGRPLVFDEARWRLRVHGACEKPLELDWAAFQALHGVRQVSDFHCVTTWSRLDNEWEGVRFRSLAELVRPLPEASFVRFADHQGYDTTVPLGVAMDEDSLLATHHDGEPLSPEHGGPLRNLVPRRYAWKSCKWLVEIEFLVEDRLGYWEARGYHNEADPWKEQRFSS